MSPRRATRRTFAPLSGRIDRLELSTPTTLGVLSDTHLHQGEAGRLASDVLDLFERFDVDLIVHAGDIVDGAVLKRLAEIAPVVAVFGNNEPLELWKELPERVILSIGPHRIGIVHGHGGANARSVARTAFPEPVDFVIYGHSHIPMIEDVDGVVYFNPGSPTDRRFARHFGVGIVHIDEQGIAPELILFDTPAQLASIEPIPGDRS